MYVNKRSFIDLLGRILFIEKKNDFVICVSLNSTFYLISGGISPPTAQYILPMRYLFFSLLISCLFSSCWSIEKGEQFKGVAPGLWRGVFKLGQQNVPVLYTVNNSDNDQPLQLSFKTGTTTVRSDSAYLYGDTLIAHFAAAQTRLQVVYQIDQMNGYLYDLREENYPIEFSGIKGPRHRFPDIREQPAIELTGEWEIRANITEDSSTTASLRLNANKNKVTGTLQRANGSSYPLEGTVQGEKLYLSGFDGRQVLWVNGNIQNAQALNEGSLKLNRESFFWEGSRRAGVSAE